MTNPSERQIPEFVTSGQAGILLGCSVRTVLRLVRAGELVPIGKLSGPKGANLLALADVQALAAARMRARTEPGQDNREADPDPDQPRLFDV